MIVGNAPEDTGAVDCGADVVTVVTGATLLPVAVAEVMPVLTLEPHGAMVVVLQEAFRRFLMRPHSLVSMLSFQ